MPRLHGLQTLVRRLLRTEMHRKAASAPAVPPVGKLSSLAVARGWLGTSASSVDLVAANARKALAAPHLGRSFRLAPRVRPRAAATRSMPEVASYAPPAQRRLPIGGPTAGATGAPGSAAPPVAAVFAALVLSLATILLARFSLDLATWRSTLLTSRLEHPG